jgi:hypothetical protein
MKFAATGQHHPTWQAAVEALLAVWLALELVRSSDPACRPSMPSGEPGFSAGTSTSDIRRGMLKLCRLAQSS